MFYVKTTIDGKPAEIEIYGEEIHTRCFNCGKEMQVDEEMLLEVLKDGDLSSTSISCCNNEFPRIKRIK